MPPAAEQHRVEDPLQGSTEQKLPRTLTTNRIPPWLCPWPVQLSRTASQLQYREDDNNKGE